MKTQMKPKIGVIVRLKESRILLVNFKYKDNAEQRIEYPIITFLINSARESFSTLNKAKYFQVNFVNSKNSDCSIVLSKNLKTFSLQSDFPVMKGTKRTRCMKRALHPNFEGVEEAECLQG